ncbi:MAG: lysophospholipid acyltransferase family protein [Pseudomonadota bacterium]
MNAPPSGHTSAWAAVKATAYVIWFYLFMVVWGAVFFLPSAFSRGWTTWTMKTYTRIVFAVLRVVCGTRCELRGELPQGPCIVAAKHQSFLDVMMTMLWMPAPRFVMKRSILYTPVLGVYAWRLGCIPIDRARRGAALSSMIEWIHTRGTDGGQVIIFPQGTRVPPGEERAYKAGVTKLYDATGLPIVLVAVNTGWFWPKTGLRRSPGTAVMEIIGRIEPGQDPETLLSEIESRIETASARLAEQAAQDFR